jgi:hypothetical protein
MDPGKGGSSFPEPSDRSRRREIGAAGQEGLQGGDGSAPPPAEIGGDQPRRGQATGLGQLKGSGVRDQPRGGDPAPDGYLQDHVRGLGRRSFDSQAERARRAVAAAT